MKNKNKQAEIASNYKKIIQLIGEDFSREGLKKTPLRSGSFKVPVDPRQSASARTATRRLAILGVHARL